MDETALAILDTWFGDWSDDQPLPAGGPPQNALWWGKDAATDASLRERFGAANRAAKAGSLDHWRQTPRECLALVILLDQISRNIYRDTPEMFAADAQARDTLRHALTVGHEAALTLIERYFLYMPLMHSEDPRDHELAVDRFSALAAAAEGSPRAATYQGALEYENKHRDIVQRFGRYPHRNTMLGRDSTEDERTFLSGPGSSF